MKHGEIWTVSGGGYAGKPRPAVILQDDRFDTTGSITVCTFTTNQTDAPFFRLPVVPTSQNGLCEPCLLMVDKITTVPKSHVGTHVGRLDDQTIQRLNRAIFVFLGLAEPPSRQRAPQPL